MHPSCQGHANDKRTHGMEVEWSDMALAQLGDVIEYVSDNFGERVALNTYDKIDAKVKSLVKFPESGRYDNVMISAIFPLRHLAIAPNVLYYFVDTEQDKIVLLSFVHSKQSSRTVNAMLKKSLLQYKMKFSED